MSNTYDDYDDYIDARGYIESESSRSSNSNSSNSSSSSDSSSTLSSSLSSATSDSQDSSDNPGPPEPSYIVRDSGSIVRGSSRIVRGKRYFECSNYDGWRKTGINTDRATAYSTMQGANWVQYSGTNEPNITIQRTGVATPTYNMFVNKLTFDLKVAGYNRNELINYFSFYASEINSSSGFTPEQCNFCYYLHDDPPSAAQNYTWAYITSLPFESVTLTNNQSLLVTFAGVNDYKRYLNIIAYWNDYNMTFPPTGNYALDNRYALSVRISYK